MAVSQTPPQGLQTPDSSQVTLALLPLELRVSDCKGNFVNWPFKELPVSPDSISP